MRLGVMAGTAPSRRGLFDLIAQAEDLESRGFHSLWIPHVFGLDAVTAAAVIGRATRRIELGTAVVPTRPRHPAALAQQALTAGAACSGRFTLGIGLSHPVVIENVLGLSYARPAGHMREYLAVLGPLLRGEAAKSEGAGVRVDLSIRIAEADPVPVLLAALGERMLDLAGRSAAGTILWMTGPRTIERHVAPRLRAAAREAGRGDPRIVAGAHIALTAKPRAVLERLGRRISVYGELPSYRAMLEREGGARPTDLALVGDERVLDAGLARLRDAGATDFEAVIVHADDETEARTLDYLQDRLENPRWKEPCQ